MQQPIWNLQRILLSEKMAIPKGYLLNYFIYITFLKWKKNNRNGDQISGYHRLESDWDDTRELYGDDNILHLTIPLPVS